MRGFLEIEHTAPGTQAALLGHRLDQCRTVKAGDCAAVTFGQQRRITLQQQFGEIGSHLLIDVGVGANRVARGQHQAVTRMGDRRPHQAGRIEQHGAVIKLVTPQLFGDRRLIADRRDAAFQQRVDQGRLADVRNTHHQHAHRLHVAVAMRHQAGCQAQHARHVGRLLATQRHRLDRPLMPGFGAIFRLDRLDPGGGHRRVGDVGLVQYLQAGPLPMGAHFADDRVAAGAGQTSVEHLDDNVDLRHGLGRLLAGGHHVAGIPTDGHACVNLVCDDLVKRIAGVAARPARRQVRRSRPLPAPVAVLETTIRHCHTVPASGRSLRHRCSSRQRRNLLSAAWLARRRPPHRAAPARRAPPEKARRPTARARCAGCRRYRPASRWPPARVSARWRRKS